MELLEGEGAALAGFTLPDDGSFIAARTIEMPIEAIFTGIELSAYEPLCKRRLPIQGFGPFLLPKKLGGLAGPKFFGILEGLSVKFFIIFKAFHDRFF